MQNNNIINEAIYFIVFVLSQTITQIITFFGQIIIFGLLLYVLSNLTRRVYAKTLGAKAEVYITGFIGTPVHELSHALFCIIFNHKINEIKLFNPKGDSQTLGYVMHSYDKRSWYQQSGNFFIGIAPIIVGSVIIYFLLYFILPNIKDEIFYIDCNNMFLSNSGNSTTDILLASFQGMIKLFTSTFNNIKTIFLAIITNDNIKTFKFWIFIFITISIASHIELSPADIMHALKGIVYIIAFFLIVNALLAFITLMSDGNILGKTKEYVTNFFNIILMKSKIILLVALLFSILNFLLTYILLTPFSLIKYRRFINLVE